MTSKVTAKDWCTGLSAAGGSAMEDSSKSGSATESTSRSEANSAVSKAGGSAIEDSSKAGSATESASGSKGGVSRLLAHVKPSVPATTRLLCQVTPKEEETPEFGQFFRDVSSMLKEKTGETGHKLLAGGLLTYMLSKELLILHDETLLGAVMAATVYALYLKISQPITDILDERSQEILDLYNEGRNSQIEVLTKAIEEEKKIEYMLTARKDIVEVMRENNAMSLEVEYRNRLHEVVREVKKRLDYQAEMEAFQRKTEQEHIIDWVEQQVVKSITPQLEKDSVSQCIKDLKAMTPA